MYFLTHRWCPPPPSLRNGFKTPPKSLLVPAPSLPPSLPWRWSGPKSEKVAAAPLAPPLPFALPCYYGYYAPPPHLSRCPPPAIPKSPGSPSQDRPLPSCKRGSGKGLNPLSEPPRSPPGRQPCRPPPGYSSREAREAQARPPFYPPNSSRFSDSPAAIFPREALATPRGADQSFGARATEAPVRGEERRAATGVTRGEPPAGT